MVFGAGFDMGYKGSYMVMPLPKTKVENGVKWSVKCDSEEEINKKINKKDMTSLMGNLDDIKKADSNHDNIISLNELRACDNKTEFMEHLIFQLEQFEKGWNASNHH